MTHLTQVTLDFATAARLRLRDCYDWHQAVWKAFPGRDGEPRDFLTRLDQRREGFRLLIVSPAQATGAARLVSARRGKLEDETDPGYVFLAPPVCVPALRQPDKESLQGTVRRLVDEKRRRVPLGKREELVEWIKRKGEQGGFTVDEATLRTFSRGREYFEKNGQPGLHSAVEFQGVLTVTDPAKFHGTFTRGIGSAKAFGFGLLVIAPIS